MFSDKEIMSGAEAVVLNYIHYLLGSTGSTHTETSSQRDVESVSIISSTPFSTTKRVGLKNHNIITCANEKKIELLRRDAQTFYVLSCVVDMVEKGLMCTERDVYYRNAPLFPNGQREVHSSIDRLCRWMNSMYPLYYSAKPHGVNGVKKEEPRPYTREGIRIGASGKSILTGYLSFDVPKRSDMTIYNSHSTQDPASSEVIEENLQTTSNCTSSHSTHLLEIDVMRHTSGVLIDTMVGLKGCRFRGARGSNIPPSALVLVEKESTLRTLMETNGAFEVDAPLHRCVFVCSKGYPCRASRNFLRNLHRELPHLPIFLLVDGDPHGLRIALTFIGLFGDHGTPQRRNARKQQRIEERADYISQLLPARWVGVRPSALPHRTAGRTPLTSSDHQVLSQVMQRISETLEILEVNDGVSTSREKEIDLLRSSFQNMLDEAEWMKKNSLKCSLQAWPNGPVDILGEFL
ncbi:putative meiotic recombination protein spo11 [Trypanosoma theileri]|uniref:DNA topoisomerase (ATP-hydrolyzing) n=1 Tax=Trypanosoma theileri TaxID=67003 RepID=A0A1X0NL58_9TRYP|nr:putative meiotic recombination protein spo11 [Trypanosoma theileri]ORC85183.1 putative meiotic recombination protein spo11 [Trypanosoma theileri]